jgi:hypothetical protein
MFEIDLRTLYTSFVVMLVVLLAVVALIWAQTRKRFDGLFLLVVYMFVQLLGITLIALRGLIPDFASVILANGLVVGGAMLAFVGLEKFTGLRSSYVKHYLLLTVFDVLNFTYHTYLYFPIAGITKYECGVVIIDYFGSECEFNVFQSA